jgi:hypothetical protein
VLRKLVCTREPSGSRASTQGDVASTRRPRGATMCSITVEDRLLPLKQTVRTLSIRPQRSLCVDLRKEAPWAYREPAPHGRAGFLAEHLHTRPASCVHGAMEAQPGQVKLVRESVEAEDESFEAFFDAEWPRLFRALLLLTGNAHEAEDLTQGAFLKLLERWDALDHGTDLEGYLFRTAPSTTSGGPVASSGALGRAVPATGGAHQGRLHPPDVSGVRHGRDRRAGRRPEDGPRSCAASPNHDPKDVPRRNGFGVGCTHRYTPDLEELQS